MTNKKVVITDYNNMCVVENTTREMDNFLHQFFRVKAEKPYFSKAYKKGIWDGYHRFYQKKNHCFPAGLLPILKTKFPNSLEIIQHSAAPDIIPVEKLNTITPRADQLKLVKDAFREKRGILQAPTGSGKSIVISLMCKSVPGNILILVHTLNLLHQTAAVLEKEIGEKIGKIGDGLYDEQRITIASIQTLHKLGQEELTPKMMIILDEAHHASAATFYKTIVSNTAPLRFGLSADTFDKHKLKADRELKNYRIMACFGPLISNVTNEELKKEQVLAKANIKFIKMENPFEDLEDEVYLDAYCKYHCKNKRLYDKVGKLCGYHKDDNILILVKHIHHGSTLEKLLKKDYDVLSKFVCGEFPTQYIEEAVSNFKKGKLKVLIASTIFNEGTNIPEIDVLINAAGDMGPTKQRLGRALRKREDKDTVQIYDFYLKGNKHIEHHAKTRFDVYKNEGHEVE